MGDLNMDYAKWNHNDNPNQRLIQLVKDEIETIGFSQQIVTETRAWKGQASSILDHIWSNAPGRLIFSKNVKRSFSDHNLLWTQFKTKEKVKTRHNFWKRERRNLDEDRYRLKMSQINWSEFYDCDNLDLKNSLFEENILKVLNSEAPLNKFQSRTMFRKWISPELKQLMDERDNMKSTALNSGTEVDWSTFKTLRNNVVKKLKKEKKEFFRKMYENAERQKTTKELYKLTKELQDTRDGNAPQTLIIDGKPVRKPEINGKLPTRLLCQQNNENHCIPSEFYRQPI